jgi:hypothetical protein
VKRWTRRVLEIAAALVAALVVAFFTVDLVDIARLFGVDLIGLAEREGSRALERRLHIGDISAKITPGDFVVSNLVIEGRNPGDRPFIAAERIAVHVDWSALWRDEIVLEVTMTDWDMVIERWADSRHNVPRLRFGGGGEPSAEPPRFRTRVSHVYALGGRFTYDDHGAPWSVVAPNLDVNVVRNPVYGRYDGTAHFRDGTVRILDFLPMWTNFATRFTLDGSLVRLHQIDLETDGARSAITGVVDFGKWPEQRYEVRSAVDFARMREIFFADREDWAFSGEGRFTGFFHLFKEGRELSGDFTSAAAGVNGVLFEHLRGSLTWLPESFAVHKADADFYGGPLTLTYGLAPLGTPGGATATFTADYQGQQLSALAERFDLGGLQPRGSLAGSVSMSWPNGRFSEGLAGTGRTTIAPPAGVRLAGPTLPTEPYVRPPSVTDFDGSVPLGPFPAGGELQYWFDPSGLTFENSWAATPTTFIAFSGTTGGGVGDIAFRATSREWQDSDRVLAAVLTSRGSPTKAIEVGGRGTFDGTMTGPFASPRITGRFASEALRAWDVDWGDATGNLVVEGGYVEIADGVVQDGAGGTIRTDGRFSLGFRDDGKEEINARFRITGWPLEDLRHAFTLDDWSVDGTIADLDLTLNGPYRGPFGSGRLRLEPGEAWGERFAWVQGELEFEGDGLQIRGIEMDKSGGRVRGAAHIGWNNTYDFDADGEHIPVESLDNFRFERAPLTGVMRFTATGGGSFDDAVYEISPVIPDLYVGDEFVGQVSGRVTVRAGVMTVDSFLATSPLGTVNGSGRISLGESSDAVLDLNFFDTSLDPYLRFFGPELAGYLVATASGRVHVEGPLSSFEQVDVTATLDAAQLTLLQFTLQNEDPVRLALRGNRFSIEHARLVGADTSLTLEGGVDFGSEQVNVGLSGDASLTILQLFFPEMRTSGAAAVRARLEGPVDGFRLAGQAQITGGRLRHRAFQQSLSEINGTIVFDRSGVNLDALSARLGEGRVQFGGGILLDGTAVSEFNVRARGTAMNLRYPEGLRSTVNADLELTGTPSAPRLTGNVDVLRATYRAPLDPSAGLLGYLSAASGQLRAEEVLPEPVPEETGFPLVFDVRVVANRLSEPIMNLPDLTIYASADLQFSGTVDRPQLSGSLTIDPGRSVLFFSGNRFVFQRGTITFLGGGTGFDPFFDIELVTRVRVPYQTYQVNLRVTGTENSFVPSLTADPPIASDVEILGLLFGELPDLRQVEQRSLQSPQQAQATLLRTAAAQLLASPITTGVQRALQQVVPFDTIAITPVLGDSTADRLNPTARITVGQRLSSRVYVTYSRALNAASEYEVILIEYDQTDRLSWVLSRNEDRTFALDFRIRYVF